jgi:hypothetical protein
MTTGHLDRGGALILGAGIALVLLLRFVVFADRQPALIASTNSIPQAERRLARLRQVVATLPGKDKDAKQAAADLANREKGIIAVDTAAQAQAQLLEVIRRAGKDGGIDVRGAEEMRVRPLANDYGEVEVAVSFTCTIDQFVNLMADLANRPELLSTSDIRVSAANPKEKTIAVRLGLSGVVPRKLVPLQKGPVSF